MSAVSCVEEPTDMTAASGMGTVSFEASFGAASKAVLEPGKDESKVAWEAGDRVSVLAGGHNYLYSAASSGYTTLLTTEAVGIPSSGTFYAVYPYDADASFTEEKLSTSLPAVQTAVPGSFSTHLAVARTTDTHLAFKNVCGLVKITIDADNVTKVVFEGNNSEVVAGGIAITVSNEPSWTVVAGKGETSVTLLPPTSQTTIARGVYYFSALPQKFSAGFKVTAYKGDEASVVRNVTSEYTLERADIMGGKAFGIDGAGTEVDPYILRTPQDMVDMRSLAKSGGETWFVMANDIDMKSVRNYEPVNNRSDEGFSRKIHFDGGNNTLSNFSCSAEVYPSIFGVLYGSCSNLVVVNATINATDVAGVIGGYVGTLQNETSMPGFVENVIVTGSTVTSDRDRVGGICGEATEATFTNVSFEGTVVGNNTDVGGFAGKTTRNVSFSECDVKAAITSNVSAKNRCGGFVGWNSPVTASYKDCHVLAGTTITNKTARTSYNNGYFGGFIGYGDTAGAVTTISGCSADVAMDVDEKSNYNGGFIGGTGYASETTVTDCHAAGTVNGGKYIGGFVGALQSPVTISACSSSAAVSASGEKSGGFIGTMTHTNSFDSCYATGDVTSTDWYVGGFIGHTKVAMQVSNCYAEGNVTSTWVSDGNSKKYCAAGGLVGCVESGTTTISACYASGNISVKAQNNGGLVGCALSDVSISRSYATGNVTGNVLRCGGLVGHAGKSCTIDNSYSTGNVQSTQQQLAGIVAFCETTGSVSITNCFSAGDIGTGRGSAGILGNSQSAAGKTSVVGCIAWNKNITTSSRSTSNYAPAAVVGSSYYSGTFQNCLRRSDMVLTDAAGTSVLYDQANVTGALLPLPTGVTGNHNRSYHGKATTASTISDAAKSIGWSEDIWDLSEDIPVLNNYYTGTGDTQTSILYPVAGAGKTTTLQTSGYFSKRTVADGITHYYATSTDAISGVRQNVNVLEIDLDNEKYKVQFYYGNYRDTLSRIALAKGAKVAINGTYELDASYIRTNRYNHHKVDLASSHLRYWKHNAAVVTDGERKVGIVNGAPGQEATPEGGLAAINLYNSLSERNLLSGAPMLIDDFEPVGASFVPSNLSTSYLNSLEYEDYRRHQGVRHPRTAVALTADNDLLLVVVDRHPLNQGYSYAYGMTARELTNFLVRHFNPRWAMNLDGGGSSTMYIKGAGIQGYGGAANDVVNYPDENSRKDHYGQRPLRTAILVCENQ